MSGVKEIDLKDLDSEIEYFVFRMAEDIKFYGMSAVNKKIKEMGYEFHIKPLWNPDGQ